MAMTKSITGRKTKIRHKTFMPPKMPKVPKMTLPNFCTKHPPAIRSAKRRAVGGPWDGRDVSTYLSVNDKTMLFSANGKTGRYENNGCGELIWHEQKCA